ncbi:hypothetical protein X943_001900 [Babesia divergens]|uniref:Uncharacterized protein n=1 Tax=Babesia divergens TaxID=32595 RepID=A0AAD9G717_BABDI|nr:hypothetical protein X943_001900 [Babesia divergens]
MDNWGFIRLITAVYAVLAAMVIVAIRLWFRNRVDESERKDFNTLVNLLVPFITFCLWLLWACMYMAQMNPMIVPIKHIHEHVTHAEQAAPVAA